MNSRGFFGASVIAAIVASFCCILPIVFALVGVSIVGASAAFAAWRPYLLVLTLALLGVGFYIAYRPPRRQCESGDVCARPGIGRSGRIGLWIAAALVVVFAAFPHYSGPIAEWALSYRGNAAVGTTPGSQPARPVLQRAVFAVDGMDCPACASSIERQLKALPGVGKASVSYEKGRAEIQYDPAIVGLIQIERAIQQYGYRIHRLP